MSASEKHIAINEWQAKWNQFIADVIKESHVSVLSLPGLDQGFLLG